jgi:hypothetical protein
MNILEKYKFKNPVLRKIQAGGVVLTAPVWYPVVLIGDFAIGLAHGAAQSYCCIHMDDKYKYGDKIFGKGLDDARTLSRFFGLAGGAIIFFVPCMVARIAVEGSKGVGFAICDSYKNFTK